MLHLTHPCGLFRTTYTDHCI